MPLPRCVLLYATEIALQETQLAIALDTYTQALAQLVGSDKPEEVQRCEALLATTSLRNMLHQYLST